MEYKIKELFIRTISEQMIRKKESTTWYETQKRKGKEHPPKYNEAFEEIYEIGKSGISLETNGKIDEEKLKKYYERKRNIFLQ